MRFTLGKQEKLKSRKIIEQLFIEGKTVKEFPIRLKFLKVQDSSFPIQVAFSVPKKKLKHAVDRNSMKRLMRETYRLNKYILFNNLTENYVIMFIYIDKLELEFALLEQIMKRILNKFVEHVKHNE